MGSFFMKIDKKYIAKRKLMTGRFRFFGIGMTLLCLGAYLWLLLRTPLLANPFYTFGSLREDTIPYGMLYLSQSILPIVTTLVFLLLLVLILFTYLSIRNESRYIEFIEDNLSE